MDALFPCARPGSPLQAMPTAGRTNSRSALNQHFGARLRRVCDRRDSPASIPLPNGSLISSIFKQGCWQGNGGRGMGLAGLPKHPNLPDQDRSARPPTSNQPPRRRRTFVSLAPRARLLTCARTAPAAATERKAWHGSQSNGQKPIRERPWPEAPTHPLAGPRKQLDHRCPAWISTR
jgi:hypothetical protein